MMVAFGLPATAATGHEALLCKTSLPYDGDGIRRTFNTSWDVVSDSAVAGGGVLLSRAPSPFAGARKEGLAPSLLLRPSQYVDRVAEDIYCRRYYVDCYYAVAHDLLDYVFDEAHGPEMRHG